jgi:predicted GH43/DUF377 family glycosyl hydrolase
MKYIIIRDCKSNLKKDRFIINYDTKSEMYNIATLGLLEESKDFNLKDEIIVCENFDSYQLRPKALYKNNKGIYYKKSINRGYLKKQEIYYLDEKEIKELDNFLIILER